MTLREAENLIRRRFAATGFRGELNYDASKVIETERWWYIPCCWIGCQGFIVNKDDLYVNWLGSSLSLEECFWGHDQGVVCDLVDFRFFPDTRVPLVRKLVAKFKHTHPNAKGVPPSEPVWYLAEEVETAVSTQFPLFSRHFVWFCVPELMAAHSNDGLRFTCSLHPISHPTI